MLSKVTFAACLIAAASARCQKPDIVQDFDGEAYMGTWYQIQKTSDVYYIGDEVECTTAFYSNFDAEEGTFDVYNSCEQPGSDYRTGGKAKAECINDEGSCFVIFYGIKSWRPNYLVIDTDYDNYALVYSCNWLFQKEILYILSRDPTPSEEEYQTYLQKAADALPLYDFDDFAPMDVQGSSCSYLDTSNFQ
mmetsp:Transcript_27241/g.19645  ORF Transcript_27241/g.19645 Transcript_27241/m.19645 type:complete len:192 (-) Transcript_27241:91-666(-)